MAILCIHNPVMHKSPQTYYRVEVGFTKLHTCPQQAVDQVCSVVNGEYGDKVLNLVHGWQHYRPSRVGPVLRLPAANGNRKVTVLAWLEPPSPAEPVTQAQQMFNQSELALIKEVFETQNIWVEGGNEVAKQVYAKACQLLKGAK